MKTKQKIALLLLPISLLTACSTDGGVDPMVQQNQSFSDFPEVAGLSGSKPEISAP